MCLSAAFVAVVLIRRRVRASAPISPRLNSSVSFGVSSTAALIVCAVDRESITRRTLFACARGGEADSVVAQISAIMCVINSAAVMSGVFVVCE